MSRAITWFMWLFLQLAFSGGWVINDSLTGTRRIFHKIKIFIYYNTSWCFRVDISFNFALRDHLNLVLWHSKNSLSLILRIFIAFPPLIRMARKIFSWSLFPLRLFKSFHGTEKIPFSEWKFIESMRNPVWRYSFTLVWNWISTYRVHPNRRRWEREILILELTWFCKHLLYHWTLILFNAQFICEQFFSIRFEGKKFNWSIFRSVNWFNQATRVLQTKFKLKDFLSTLRFNWLSFLFGE